MGFAARSGILAGQVQPAGRLAGRIPGEGTSGAGRFTHRLVPYRRSAVGDRCAWTRAAWWRFTTPEGNSPLSRRTRTQAKRFNADDPATCDEEARCGGARAHLAKAGVAGSRCTVISADRSQTSLNRSHYQRGDDGPHQFSRAVDSQTSASWRLGMHVLGEAVVTAHAGEWRRACGQLPQFSVL